jgi:hypothetical protein
MLQDILPLSPPPPVFTSYPKDLLRLNASNVNMSPKHVFRATITQSSYFIHFALPKFAYFYLIRMLEKFADYGFVLFVKGLRNTRFCTLFSPGINAIVFGILFRKGSRSLHFVIISRKEKVIV